MAQQDDALAEAKIEIERLRVRVRSLEGDPFGEHAVVRSIAENASDNIMLLDRDLRIQYINWTVPDLSPDRVRGHHVNEFVPEEFHSDVLRTYGRVAESRQQHRYEVSYISEDGDISVWEARVSAVIQDDEHVGFVSINSNITERRKAAADPDRFFNLSLDILCVIDADGTLRRVNPAFETILQLAEDEVIGRPLTSFLHPGDVEVVQAKLQALGADQRPIEFEGRFRRKQGRYRRISFRVAADPERNVAYAVARDVTERRQLEAQLRQSQKMDAIGQLAGGVAHDFNNLILAIQANADFAERELQAEARQEYLTEVKRAAQRAAGLTRQLLTFSRRQVLRPVELDLNELGRDLMKMLRRLIHESIELEFRPGEGLERIDADPGQMEQVLVNLCVNARDAIADRGKIVIETSNATIEGGDVSTHPWARPGRYVRLRVADDGAGMSPEVRDRLFEPFFSTKEPGKGTGLGLSTLYGIVEQHRGFVRVRSESGAGSTFDVYLPTATGTARGVAAAPVAERPGGDETILVAEDEAIVRSVVVRTLEDAGYRVVVATDGEDAVRAFKASGDSVDLLLLDVIMPRLSGPEALQEIVTVRPDIRYLFTSGYSDAAAFRDVSVHGRQVVQKPFTPDVLLAEVRKALDAPA